MIQDSIDLSLDEPANVIDKRTEAFAIARFLADALHVLGDWLQFGVIEAQPRQPIPPEKIAFAGCKERPETKVHTKILNLWFISGAACGERLGHVLNQPNRDSARFIRTKLDHRAKLTNALNKVMVALKRDGDSIAAGILQANPYIRKIGVPRL